MTIVEKNLIEECKSVRGTSVRTDKHLAPIYDCIKGKVKANELANVLPKKAITPTQRKTYDLRYEDESGEHAIELKSINGSSAKNINNRLEEMSGQSWSAKSIYGHETFSYVFVINCPRSEEIKERIYEYARCLREDGYLDRFSIYDTYSCSFYKTDSFESWHF
mgnify:FL=1|jgi:hypothetical protein